MGRFDVLKENTFQDSKKKNKKQKKQNKNNPTNTPTNNPTNNPTNTPTNTPTTNETKEESAWIKRIKSQENTEKNIINEKDPKYWKGPIWCGPMFIKAKEKQSKKWKQYIKHACDKNTSSILLPKYTLLYSRNNVNWYSSFEESFSEKQLENIKIYEKEKYNERCANILEKIRIENIKRSNEYYDLTGELDDFAIANYKREKYEEYCEQFEIEENDEEDYESDSNLEEEEEINDYYN